MIAYLFYLANVASSIQTYSTIISVVSLILMVILFAALVMLDPEYEESEAKRIKYYFYWLMKISIISTFISIVIPSEKTIYLALSANYLQDSQLPDKIVKVLHKKLDEMLDETAKNSR